MEVRKVCLFCRQNEDNELLYGKIYEVDDDTVTHYFCLLLSSNLEQNGEDSEGIQGFLRADILKEYKRGKRMTCWYCKKTGATVGCCVSRCKKVFHLPCGRREGSLHQFFGQFKSFCSAHKPVQKISHETLMEVNRSPPTCTICFDTVSPMSCQSTLWAPCCSSSAWFHRDCVQRLALSAGYFFKCPLCNNTSVFQKAMLDFGIYIPEQDASWELEPNAFQELLHRHNHCDAKHCECPKGRYHSAVGTRWLIVLCKDCGSQGIHVGCGNLKWSNADWECEECTVMLKQSQKCGDSDNGDDPDPSHASVNQFPAKRKQQYFKGNGQSRRTNYSKCRVLSSSYDPPPSSSQSAAISKGGPAAMTGGSVSPPTPTEVIEISDDDIIEILDDDDDDDDDDGGGGGGDDDDDDDDKPPGKTSTLDTDRMILDSDGKNIRVIQVPIIEASADTQSFYVVGDLKVKLPCQLYAMQQVAQPAFSNGGISAAAFPVSSDDGGSSKPLLSSVDGSSSKFLQSSVDGSSYKSLHSIVDDGISSTSLYSSVDSGSSSKSLHSSLDGSSSKSLYSSVDGSSSKFLHPSVDGSSSKSLHSSLDGSSSKSLHSSVDGSSSKFLHPSVDDSSSSKSLYSSVDGGSSSKFLCSAVGGSSCSKLLPSSVDGRSSNRSLHSVVDSSSKMSIDSSSAVTHSDQPTGSGTDRRSLLKSYLISESAQGGCTYPAQVPAVVQEMDGRTPARTQAQNPDTSTMQHSAPRTLSHNAAGSPSNAFCNRPHGDRYDQQHDSCICASSQRESRHLGAGLNVDSVRENVEFRVTVSKQLQVVSFNHDTVADDVPLPAVQQPFQSHVIQTVPAVPQNMTVALTDGNVLTPQVSHLKNPEQLTTCSCEEAGVSESYSETGIGNSCSEMGLSVTCSEMGIGDSTSEVGQSITYSKVGIGDSFSERGVGDSFSEGGVGDSCSEGGVGNSCSEGGVVDCAERGGDSCSEGGVYDSCSDRGLSGIYSEIEVDDTQMESQVHCHQPIRSKSPVVTRSRSKCLLQRNTHLTRSQSKKMTEARGLDCRCETCRVTKMMLEQKDWKVHKDHKFNCNTSDSVGEMLRVRYRSDCRGTQLRRIGRTCSWNGTTSKFVRKRHGSGSCTGTLQRRDGALIGSGNTRDHAFENIEESLTFNPAETRVQSYSEQNSYSERRDGDMHSVIEFNDSCSETGVVDSEMESRVHGVLSVRSFSPVVTRSRSRCLLQHNTHLTRSQSKKMAEARGLGCKCDICRATKIMLELKDSKVNYNQSVTPQRRRSKSHSWSGSTRKPERQIRRCASKGRTEHRSRRRARSWNGTTRKLESKRRRCASSGRTEHRSRHRSRSWSGNTRKLERQRRRRASSGRTEHRSKRRARSWSGATRKPATKRRRRASSGRTEHRSRSRVRSWSGTTRQPATKRRRRASSGRTEHRSRSSVRSWSGTTRQPATKRRRRASSGRTEHRSRSSVRSWSGTTRQPATKKRRRASSGRTEHRNRSRARSWSGATRKPATKRCRRASSNRTEHRSRSRARSWSGTTRQPATKRCRRASSGRTEHRSRSSVRSWSGTTRQPATKRRRRASSGRTEHRSRSSIRSWSGTTRQPATKRRRCASSGRTEHRSRNRTSSWSGTTRQPATKRRTCASSSRTEHRSRNRTHSWSGNTINHSVKNTDGSLTSFNLLSGSMQAKDGLRSEHEFVGEEIDILVSGMNELKV